MTAIKLMELANDIGFKRRVQFTMFDVAKDLVGGTPTANETSYINGIINGEAPILQMTVGVLLNGAVQGDGVDATDAQIKTAVETVFPFYAAAWVDRTIPGAV